MTPSQPISFKNFTLSGPPAEPITLHPKYLNTYTAILPTAPAAPLTKTTSPAFGCPIFIMGQYAENPTNPNAQWLL